MPFKLKYLLSTIIFSNFYISLAAAILVGGISVLLHYSHSFEISLFIFSSTLCVYSFQRLVKHKLEEKRVSELDAWIERNQIFQIFYIILSSILSIYLYFFVLNAYKSTKWWMFMSIILSVFYAVKIKGISLRDIPYLKIHLISIVWCKALLFPIFLNSDYSFFNLLFIVGFYFFFIAVCIPFDIRDVVYDNPKLKTLPQIVGIRNSIMISIVSILIFGFISFISFPQLKINFFFWLAILISILILSKAKKNKHSYYYSFLVDGLIIMIGVSFFA